MSAQAQVVVALLTPFDERGNPDGQALAAHIASLLESGVDALMPCGTTGEGVLLEEDEALAVIEATVAAAGRRARVVAHVGRPSTAGTVRLAQRALDVGAHGISALVPFFYTYSDAQVLRHFEAVLSVANGAPTYAYTLPGRTGNELTTAAVKTLAEHGLTGVKDSTKSWELHLEYLACDVDVLVGTDAFVLQALRAGAAGCVSALANVRPDLFCALRDGGDEVVQEEILRLRDAMPMQDLKAAVAARIPGYPVAYRAPLG